MKKIKVKFLDVPVGFNPDEHFYCKVLRKYYDLHLCENPDYVIDMGYGMEYLNSRYENCVKIAMTAENVVPDFTIFDYVVGFDFIEFGDRYCRFPCFARWTGFDQLTSMKHEKGLEKLVKRDFCSFVVSNGHCSDPMRRRFFERLSQYKPIASGGRYLNNIGEAVKDKIEFLRKYKFNIAFENSVVPGYTTEKVMEAFVARTVPIYYGNPLVGRDFSENAMVHLVSESDIEKVVDKIIELDQDDDAYLKMFEGSVFSNADTDRYEHDFCLFLRNVFDQPLGLARRTSPFGWQQVYRSELRRVLDNDKKYCRPIRNFRSCMGKILKKVGVR